MSNIKNKHLFSVMSYLRPRYYKMLTAHCYLNYESKSEAVEKAVIAFINGIDEKQQTALLRLYDEMPDKAKKNPKFLSSTEE
jgi:hypothetical protein